MQYIKAELQIQDSGAGEVLMARLTEIGFEGFEETEDKLIAYIPQTAFNEDELRSVLAETDTNYSLELIAEQNWNVQWEENFQPVVVEGFCTIKAHFHTLKVTTPYEILITPKMSFGTGHHATTQLVMMQMKETELKGKSVLDFGTGTGILAILAEMLGAANVVAIDNDQWCYENATENVNANNCKKIEVRLASMISGVTQTFDVILANINRHILLEQMNAISNKVSAGGTVLMSGLLKEDEGIITSAAEAVGLKKTDMVELNNWIVLRFEKK